MNVVLKGALYLVGGVSLFTGSFVGVALVTGRSAHDIPLLKNFTARPETQPSEHVTSSHNLPHSTDSSSVDDHLEDESVVHAKEKQPATASVLGAFVMPAPFNGDELAQMQSKLALRLEETEARLAGAKDKERALDERERALTGREKELQSLKNELDTRTKELIMRELEINRDGEASAAREEKSWAELARFFGEGDPEDLAKKLMAFDPKDAAKMLHQMDDERAIALVNALPQDQYKAFLDAYRKGVK
jgi:flagellar motility protein MotE (MotC chaperone)